MYTPKYYTLHIMYSTLVFFVLCFCRKTPWSVGVRYGKKVTQKRAADRAMSHPDYGAHAIPANLSPEELELTRKKVVESFKVTEGDRLQVEENTRDQGAGDERSRGTWFGFRNGRLTSSKFGQIFRMREETKTARTTVEMIHPKDISHLEAVQYGYVVRTGCPKKTSHSWEPKS